MTETSIESKEEKIQFSLNTGFDRKVNEKDGSNTFMEIASDEPIFKVLELLNDWLKGCFVSGNLFDLSHRKWNKVEVSFLSKCLKDLTYT